MSRKIIIPKGVVDDPAQNSIIEIPTKLTRSKGNLIAKKQGKKIVAQQLPDWQDELSGNNLQGSNNLVATPAGCSRPQENFQSPYPINATTFYSANTDTDKTNYLTIADGETPARTCYNTALEPTPSQSEIKVMGNDLSLVTNVESNVQMNDAMIANVLANTRRKLNFSDSLDDSYGDFNPVLSSTQKSFEMSSMQDSSEESDFFFLGAPLSRSQEGKYNIISPMTPSPTKLAAGVNAYTSARSQVNKTRLGSQKAVGDTFIGTPCSRKANMTRNIAQTQSNQTYVTPSQVSNQTYRRPQTATDRTFLRPQGAPNQTFVTPPRAPNRTFVTPQSNQTFVTPQKTPNRTFVTPQRASNKTFVTPQKASNKTFVTPQQASNKTFVTPQQASNKTFVTPQKTCNKTFVTAQQASNRTFVRPQQASNKTFVTPQQASNRTFVTPQPASNRTFVTPQQASNRTFVTPQQASNKTFMTPQQNISSLNRTQTNQSSCSCSPNTTYSDFDPFFSSTQKSFEMSSMYDSSEESEYFFMGAPVSRSQDGKYNIISPMTPSPTKLAATVNAGGAADECACAPPSGYTESVVAYQSTVTEDEYTE